MRVYRIRRQLPRHRSGEYWDDELLNLPNLTVFEPAPEPEKTGLFDSQGNELVAVDERDPIGFLRLKERCE